MLDNSEERLHLDSEVMLVTLNLKERNCDGLSSISNIMELLHIPDHYDVKYMLKKYLTLIRCESQ